MLLTALVLSLPAHNSTIRMRVWRALKQTGCGVLRDGVYVLPRKARAAAELPKIQAEIRAAGGSAMLVELMVRGAADQARVRALFDRSAAYREIIDRTAIAARALARVGHRRAQTAVARLERAFGEVSETDFFPGHARAQAAAALSALKCRLTEAYSRGEPRASSRRLRLLDKRRYQRRVWATRKDLWVDRIACAWLIKRFIDPRARFAWLDTPRRRLRGAVGFDFDGAQFSHAGNRVTFEALVASFGLEHDAALAALGAIVHFLDVGGAPVPDAKGLETALRGAKVQARSDDALLARAMPVLDLFYSAYAKASRS